VVGFAGIRAGAGGDGFFLFAGTSNVLEEAQDGQGHVGGSEEERHPPRYHLILARVELAVTRHPRADTLRRGPHILLDPIDHSQSMRPVVTTMRPPRMPQPAATGCSPPTLRR